MMGDQGREALSRESTRRFNLLAAAGRSGLLCALVFAVVALNAQAASYPLTFYVPFPGEDYLTGLQAIEATGSGTAPTNPAVSILTVAVLADDTVIRYDFWEDGYDPASDYDPPFQSTTEVWGDNNPLNGMPPGFTSDVIRAGNVIVLSNQFDTTRSYSATNRMFLARDRVAANRTISLTRTFWASGSSTLLAGTVEVYDKALWGTDYRAPVGENIPDGVATNDGDHQMFEYTALSIMAGEDATTVQIDADNNGVFETNAVLNEGQTYFVNGGVNVGGRVVASKPVQVVMLTGDKASNYESRDSSLIPVSRWSANYYTPVSTPLGDGTRVWLYNPSTSTSITVFYDYRVGTNTITRSNSTVVATNSYASVLLPEYTGAHFYTTNNPAKVFYAYSTSDSDSPTTSDNQAWDWSFTLIPGEILSPQVLVGLGIGRDPLSSTSPSEDGNPVWITPVGNGDTPITVYVDYNGDNTGPYTDPNGFHYDTNYPLRELQQQMLYDPDGDQSGLMAYVLSTNVTLAAAWGQDPHKASASEPGLDAGTSIPPEDVFDAEKALRLVIDADGDGQLGPGERIEYLIEVDNTSRAILPAAIQVQDGILSNMTYIANTTAYSTNATGAWFAVADDATGTPFPLDGTGAVFNITLNPKASFYVHFQVDVNTYSNLGGAVSIVNTGSVRLLSYNRTMPFINDSELIGSIGDRVWYDANTNGLQDVGESGISGVTVYLDVNTNGVRDASEPYSVTSSNGTYLLTGPYLSAGTHLVRVDTSTFPPGFRATYDLDGTGTVNRATVTLLGGQDRTDVDFGYYLTASVGDFTWVDSNGNGQQDVGEPALSNVAVRLFTTNNVLVGTATSTVSGAYAFTNVVPGAYYLAYAVPAGYLFTTSNVGSDVSDSDVLTGTNVTAAFVLAPGQVNTNQDAGFYQLGRLGDYTWVDVNGNGQQDGGETGLSNVTVRLLTTNSVLVAATTSSVAGAYAFTNLAPGAYLLEFVPPAGYLFTTSNVGSDASDSDPLSGTNRTSSVTLLSGTTNNTLDAGFFLPAQIGDLVWLDANGNGAYDGGESYLPNVTVRLYASDGTTLLATTSSAVDGTYGFAGLLAGAYVVQVDTADPDLPAYLSATISQYNVTVVAGQTDNSRDFPFVNHLSKTVDRSVAVVSNTLTYTIMPFYAGPALLTNATVTDVLPAGTTFGAFGQIGGVTNLPPLTWSLGTNTPAVDGSATGLPGSGSTNLPASADSWLDSANPTVNYGATTTMSVNSSGGGIGSGRPVVAFDLSSIPTVATVTGATLKLTTVSGDTASTRTIGAYGPTKTWVESQVTWNRASTATAWTTAGGDFGSVLATTSVLGLAQYSWSSASLLALVQSWVTNAAGNFGLILGDTGSGTVIKNFATKENGTTSARPVLTVSYTNPPTATTTTRLDVDQRLVTDPDPGSGTIGTNVVVTMTMGSDLALSSVAPPTLTVNKLLGTAATATLISGTPANTNIPAGGTATFTWTYRLDVASSATNWKDNLTFSGAPTHATSSFGAATSPSVILTQPLTFTAIVTNPPGVSVITNQATFRTNGAALYLSPPVTTLIVGLIGDFAWVDINANGQQDAGEPGLSNVTVRLYDAASNLVSTTTSATNGAYSFTNVVAGTYFVSFVPPPGYRLTTPNSGADSTDSDASPTTGWTGAYTLSAGQIESTVDAGFRAVGTLGDRVWLDENADGIQDAGEAGLANVRIVASNTVTGATATNWTDSTGAYLFTDLGAGTYVVRVDTNTLASGLAANQTYDPDTTTNHQTTVTLASVQDVTTADFGYDAAPRSNVVGNTGAGAIGDRVWIDADGDGLQDAGEPGMGGVGVMLVGLGADGTPGTADDTTNTTTTLADGSYLFTNLAAGAYRVVINGGTAPAGYTASGDPDGMLDNATSTPVVLAPGDVYVNADFGYWPAGGTSGMIGDLVWFDANANGTYDGSDYGIAGVSVALIRDSNGNGTWDAGERIIATTETGTNGAYSFPGLPVADGAGTDDYIVWINDTAGVLSGLIQTYDADGTGTTNLSVSANLAPAGDLLQDFGYSVPGRTAVTGLIGDTIFLDRNTNGVAEAGEGMEGVRVRLADTNGMQVATAYTDENGHYYFGGLPAGTYVVQVDTNTLAGTPGQLSNTVFPAGGSTNLSTVTLAAGQINLLQDFGYADRTNANAIGGTIWIDVNADGTQGGSETGRWAGVTVVLSDTNGNVVGRTVTDGNGDYTFAGVPDGTYRVDVTDAGNALEGTWHTLGSQNVASNGTSKADPYTLSVAGGQTIDTVDFGYYLQGGSLGNRVWWDVNGDGLQSTNDVGIVGVKLTLRIVYAAGVTNWVVTRTDTNGAYAFGYLLLDEHLPASGAGAPVFVLSATTTNAAYTPTAVDATAGTNDWIDSDQHTGVTAQVVRGQVDMSLKANPTNEPTGAWYDFGYKFKPTLARLVSFGAFSRGSDVVVRWETAEERGTLGFWLERWTQGTYQRVNTTLIPGQVFTVDGAVYQQMDAGATAGGRYTYRLIEVETSGNLLYLGPYTVEVDGPVLSFDEWSRSMFDPAGLLNPAVSALEADPDGDGADNFAEFIAGTSPTDGASALRVSAEGGYGDTIMLQWRSTPARTYAVERTSELGAAFETVAGDIPATPPLNVYTDRLDKVGGQVFYRIRVE